ncbi:MAG: hypothetical protein K1X92_08220 [Bacteroidia bacterium]|nr:hypothetical protein [Bacteroidia bacterium]
MQDNELSFSQRIGITPISGAMQINYINEDLKNTLWNIYSKYLFMPIKNVGGGYETHFSDGIWHNFFKKTLDSKPFRFKESLHDFFLSPETAWYKIYDLIEFSSKFLLAFSQNDFIYNTFIDKTNQILKKENSAYRFINGIIAPITNEYEIISLLEAIEQTKPFTSLNGANIHLTTALEFLSDKQNPNYRNSIKESISAVESIAKLISNKEKDSLGVALNRIKGEINLHTSLVGGFSQIYGYTSDEKGIRHALMDNDICDFEDAKYMIISCSAFVNYLIAKSIKADIVFT